MMNSEFWQWFNDYAAPKIDAGEFLRSTTLRKAFEHLDKFENPVVIETGCAHEPDEKGNLCWAGHGCSTILFDKYVSLNNGRLWSVDINSERVQRAREIVRGDSLIVCRDSVEFLKEFVKYDGPSPHLVYLDSYDIEWSMQTESQVHHFNELQAIFPKLTTDTLVLIDDSPLLKDDNGYRVIGKGRLIAEYANELQVPLVFSRYQTAWLGFPGSRQVAKPMAISYWSVNVG